MGLIDLALDCRDESAFQIHSESLGQLEKND